MGHGSCQVWWFPMFRCHNRDFGGVLGSVSGIQVIPSRRHSGRFHNLFSIFDGYFDFDETQPAPSRSILCDWYPYTIFGRAFCRIGSGASNSLMRRVQTREVATEETNIRVDRWFRRHFPELKHGRLEKLLRKGQIRVDGGRVKSSSRLEAGQKVRIPPLELVTESERSAIDQEVSPIDCSWINSLVLYSDADVIALNKPAGIAVQGGSGVGRHIDGLLAGLVNPGEDRPKLVHRLDLDTSGVLLVARSASVAAKLGESFRGRAAEKSYWALVSGVPSPRQGTISHPLIKSTGRDGYEKVIADAAMGKIAITDYRVVDAAGRKVSWLLLKPQTGRKHQLRVHCAGMNTPIAGDRKYGGKAAILDGTPYPETLHLHARSIKLPHPSGGELRVTAPLPAKLIQSWQFFGFDMGRG